MEALQGTGQSVSELPPEVREGEVIAGKYRIGTVIGSGAMGTVVSAHHLLFEERVAIKFLLPEALGRAEAVSRFLREARAAVRIGSEHVARVFDVDVLASGAPYIVMELLEGCDLAQWMRQHGPLPVEQAVDFILQACDALAEAHALPLRVIHRDIKPANLFAVQRAGAVQSIKVLDFGVSKTERLVAGTLSLEEAAAASVVTQQKAIIGSPGYMSPEQMESARDVDPRTDIWALGVTLYELLTGRLPFEGTTPVQVYSRITSGAPLRLRESSPQVPPGLEAAVGKCLQRDRENRFATIEHLAVALGQFGSSRAATYVQRTARHNSIEQAFGERPVASLALPSPRTPISQVTEKGVLLASAPPTGVRRNAFAGGIALALVTLLAAAAASSWHAKRPFVGLTSTAPAPPGHPTTTQLLPPTLPPEPPAEGPGGQPPISSPKEPSTESTKHHPWPPRPPARIAAPRPSSTEWMPPASPK